MMLSSVISSPLSLNLYFDSKGKHNILYMLSFKCINMLFLEVSKMHLLIK